MTTPPKDLYLFITYTLEKISSQEFTLLPFLSLPPKPLYFGSCSALAPRFKGAEILQKCYLNQRNNEAMPISKKQLVACHNS